MLPGGIAFTFEVLGGVNASLRAHRVRAFYRDDGKQINLAAHLCNLDDGGEACQAAAHYDDFRNCHAV
jgi:L-aminopeptidase/D-esterase-like protein